MYIVIPMSIFSVPAVKTCNLSARRFSLLFKNVNFLIRFLSGKPMIDTKTIPRFEYRLDNLSFQGWEDLDSKIRQFKSLPSKSVADHLESELPMIRDVSSVLEILQVTANTIALLDPQSVKSEDSLLETIRRLKIVPQSDSKVLPKSLGQLKLGHLVPVMIQLRFVRAKRMVCNNQPPFHKSAEPFHEQLPQHMLPSIDKLLHRVQPGKMNNVLPNLIRNLKCFIGFVHSITCLFLNQMYLSLNTS